MKCVDCEHFKVICNPIRIDGSCYESGEARCTKHDLVVNFVSGHHKNRLTCVEDTEKFLVKDDMVDELNELIKQGKIEMKTKTTKNNIVVEFVRKGE